MYILTTFQDHFQPFSLRQVVWSPEMSSMNVFWQIESDDVKKRDQVKNLLNSKAKKLRYKDFFFFQTVVGTYCLCYSFHLTVILCNYLLCDAC